MNHNERLRFMRAWLKDLNDIYPKDNQKEIECLSLAIKQCQKMWIVKEISCENFGKWRRLWMIIF